MPTYGRPRLITSDDKRYRAYVEQFVLQRKNQRAIRPPRQRDIFGGQAEAALRDWLAGHYRLSERRILEYEERRDKRAHIKYRELDALVLGERSAHVFEIKASRTAGSLRRAVGQLNETRAILQLLFPTVHMTILLVDTGIPLDDAAVAELMAGPTPPPRPPATLAAVLAAVPALRPIDDLQAAGDIGETVDLVRFTLDDIIALVGAENLALDWEADDLIEDQPPSPADSGPVYSTSDDDDDNNSLAAALRRAGVK